MAYSEDMREMIRWIGAAIILLASLGYSVVLAKGYAREEAALQELLEILAMMHSELNCRMTTLPELCGHASCLTRGPVSHVFGRIKELLNSHKYADAEICVQKAIESGKGLPSLVTRNILHLGRTMGRFDLDGQLADLEIVRQMCTRDLQGLRSNKKECLKTYQILGFSAGAALIILLI
jgi:stage III sporulation protein AB